MKICSKCKIEKELTEFNKKTNAKDGLQQWCKECKKEHTKKWQKTDKGKISFRKSVKNYKSKNRGKDNAGQKLRYAVNIGKLIRPKECSVCGDHLGRIEAHHYDYTKPLDVVWVCTQCHCNIHRALKESA